jgi:3,4-dihydroxy 2-butanone 4-phosphate synthase
MSSKEFEKALEDLKAGRFCMIFDSDEREKETDLCIASQYVHHNAIRRLRKDAGGLICCTVPYHFYTKIDMPFLTDLYELAHKDYKVLQALVANDIPYDAKSSFSLTVNHRRTFTGVTDRDRALTISEFAKIVERSASGTPEEVLEEFGNNFRTPGHVPLLNTSEHILSTREGHTELCTAMVLMAGLVPSATICEMMGDDGNARSKEETRRYAEENGFAFLEGSEVIKEWRARGKNTR